MPAVEREITTLAGHLAAGTCRFLQLLAAFDTGGGWHGTGMRTCAQWLSWKCGLSTGTARDQLRVAHALADLPVMRAAFAGGRLSYSKVRALSRVATPESEENLVGMATACTASQLERLCAGLSRARSNERVLDHAARACFRTVWEDDGMLRISGRLAPEDGAVLLSALAELREPAIAEPTGDNGATSASAKTPTTGGVRAEPGLPRDHHRDAGQLAARGEAAALVALARHALEQPPAAPSAAPVRLIVHTTEAAMMRGEPDGSVSAETPSPKEDTNESVPTETPTAAVLDAGPGIPLLPLGPETLRRLACQALVEPATHPDLDDSDAGERCRADEVGEAETERGRRPRVEHRFASVRQRRALLRRDGGCAWPGCPRRRGLHTHHRIAWSEGGATTLENLALTCAYHHRLLHEGGWQLRPQRDPVGRRRWFVVHTDGRTLPPSPGTAGDAEDLRAAHDADIAPGTVTGTWGGEPLERAYAVSVFAP